MSETEKKETRAMKTVAIIGGETHIGEVTALAGKRLEIVGYAVCEDQVEKTRRGFDGPVMTDYRALLDQAAPDIVSVANENDLKSEVCLEALRRKRHVIADKPLALTLAEIKAIRSAAQAADKSVLMLLTLRGDPFYRKVREIVLSGEIGEPVQLYQKMSVELKWDVRPRWFFDCRRSGGPMLDLAIHGVDQFEWVSGRRLLDVTAQEGNLGRRQVPGLIDSGAMFFRMDNGGTAFIEQNRVMPDGQGSDYRLRIVGSKGQVDMRRNHYLWVQTASGRREVTLDTLGPPVSVVANWLDSLQNGTEALVPEEASFRANEVCCKAILSAATRTTVPLV